MGRSISRLMRVALVEGRPPRLMTPPGIFPMAYLRSSKSQTRGRKSIPSRAVWDIVAVPRMTDSLTPRRTEPPACLATRPDSRWKVCPPTSKV